MRTQTTEEQEEQEDLNTLHTKTAEIEKDAFSYLEHLLTMNTQDLADCGHKTLSAAIEHTVRGAIADKKRATNAFLKKWPD